MPTEDYEANFYANKEIIIAAGLPYNQSRFNGNTVVFRFTQPGKPTVDFYPHTGKWKVLKGRPFPTYGGGAALFLEHYKKL